MNLMNADTMKKALKTLDGLVEVPVKLVIAGGAAMVLSYDFPLATHDIDAVPYDSTLDTATIENLARKVADTFSPKIPSDWLNPYYESFSYVLPKDYGTRLRLVYQGEKLRASALGLEDLLIMKCFAGRNKDIPHARYLIKKGAKVDFVAKHISHLIQKNIPKAQAALDFLDDLTDHA